MNQRPWNRAGDLRGHMGSVVEAEPSICTLPCRRCISTRPPSTLIWKASGSCSRVAPRAALASPRGPRSLGWPPMWDVLALDASRAHGRKLGHSALLRARPSVAHRHLGRGAGGAFGCRRARLRRPSATHFRGFDRGDQSTRGRARRPCRRSDRGSHSGQQGAFGARRAARLRAAAVPRARGASGARAPRRGEHIRCSDACAARCPALFPVARLCRK